MDHGQSRQCRPTHAFRDQLLRNSEPSEPSYDRSTEMAERSSRTKFRRSENSRDRTNTRTPRAATCSTEPSVEPRGLRIALECRTANDPGMISSAISAHRLIPGSRSDTIRSLMPDADEITVFVRVSRDAGMDSFLSGRGIHVRRSHGLFASLGEIAKTLAERPEPYIVVTTSALAIRQAFRAYSDTHKKRIIIRDERGNELDATNYSVDDLKKLNPMNAFEVPDDNAK